MICGRVDAWPSLCWTWSMLFLCCGGYSLLIAVVQVISSTSGRCEWWFVVLRMVIDGEVASWRLVWTHAADEHGAMRCVWWPPLMVVGLRTCGVVRLYWVEPADRVGSGACRRSCGLQPRHNRWFGCNLAPLGGFVQSWWWPCWQRRWSRHEVDGRTLVRDGHCGCMPGQQPNGCGRWICSGQMWHVPYVQRSTPKALRGDLAPAVSWLVNIGIQRYLSCSRMSSVL
jgi:hypothetical protein